MTFSAVWRNTIDNDDKVSLSLTKELQLIRSFRRPVLGFFMFLQTFILTRMYGLCVT